MDFNDINCRYKPIEGFPNYYITEIGEVYSTMKIGIGKHSKLHKLTPKNPGASSKYFNVILCKDGVHFTKSIHRLVAEAFVDGCFDGAVVNHIDGNNRNNRADNLEWVSTKVNIHKSYLTSGLGPKRNFKRWNLFSPSGALIGSFESHFEMEKFVVDSRIDAAPTQLTKKCKSRGYYVIKN